VQEPQDTALSASIGLPSASILAAVPPVAALELTASSFPNPQPVDHMPAFVSRPEFNDSAATVDALMPRRASHNRTAMMAAAGVSNKAASISESAASLLEEDLLDTLAIGHLPSPTGRSVGAAS